MSRQKAVLPWIFFVLALCVGAYTLLQSRVRLERIALLNERYASLQALSQIQHRFYRTIEAGNHRQNVLPALSPDLKETFGLGGFRLNESPPERLTGDRMLKEATVDIQQADAESVTTFLRTLHEEAEGWVVMGVNLDAVGRSGQIAGQIRLAGIESDGGD